MSWLPVPHGSWISFFFFFFLIFWPLFPKHDSSDLSSQPNWTFYSFPQSSSTHICTPGKKNLTHRNKFMSEWYSTSFSPRSCTHTSQKNINKKSQLLAHDLSPSSHTFTIYFFPRPVILWRDVVRLYSLFVGKVSFVASLHVWVSFFPYDFRVYTVYASFFYSEFLLGFRLSSFMNSR